MDRQTKRRIAIITALIVLCSTMSVFADTINEYMVRAQFSRLDRIVSTYSGDADNLGTLDHYNGIIFDYYESYSADIEGALAVGGESKIGTSGQFDFGACAHPQYNYVAMGAYPNPNNYPTLLLNGLPQVGASWGSNVHAYGGPLVLNQNLQAKYQSLANKIVADKGTLYATNGVVDAFFENAYSRTVEAVEAFNGAETAGREENLVLSDITGWWPEPILGDKNKCSADSFQITGGIDFSASAGLKELEGKVAVIHVSSDARISLNGPRLHSGFRDYELIVFNFPDAVNVEFTGSSLLLDGVQINTSANYNHSPAENAILKTYAEKIIWNFPKAESVNINWSGVVGSVLAPYALVAGNGGSINGMLVSNSFTQTNGMELHGFRIKKPVFDLGGGGEDEVAGSVKITKIESGNSENRLQGASFHLEYKEDGAWKDYDGLVYTTAQDGVFSIEELPLGDYRLKETAAPDGFELPEGDAAYTYFSITQDGAASPVEVEIENDRYREVILVKKTSYENEELPGAVFHLYKLLDGTKTGNKKDMGFVISGQDGTIKLERLTNGTYLLVETSPPADYHIVPGYEEITITLRPGEDEPVIENLNGVMETNIVPNEYDETADPSDVPASVMVLKREKGSEKIPPAGTEFDLFILEGEWVAYPSENNNHYIIDNDEGELTLEGLKLGTYMLRETKAPEGYILPEGSDAEFIFDVSEMDTGRLIPIKAIIENEKQLGSLEVVKTSEVDGTRLSGAAFDLYLDTAPGKEKDPTTSVDVKKVASGVTGQDGVYTFHNLEPGMYYLVETKAPDNFVASDRWIPQSIGIYSVEGQKVYADYAPSVTITNAPDVGMVRVIKAERPAIAFEGDRAPEEPERLEGARFQLYQYSWENHIWQGSFVRNTIWGDIESTHYFTSDNEGEFYISGLYPAMYALVEVEAPVGYDLSTDPIVFTVSTQTDAESAEGIQLQHIYAYNDPVEPEGEISFVKVDVDDSEKRLQGAVFNLYKWSDYGNQPQEPGITPLIYTAYRSNLQVDEDGILLIEELQAGTYELVEIQAPAGYSLDETSIVFEMVVDGDRTVPRFTSESQPEKIGEHFVVANKETPTTSVTLRKADDIDGTGLPEAVFTLYRQVGGELYTYRENLLTDQDGLLRIEKLEVGDYRLREIQPPNGYVGISEDIQFSIKTSSLQVVVHPDYAGETDGIDILVKNERIKSLVNIRLYKADEWNENQPVEGAAFVLVREREDEIAYYMGYNGSVLWTPYRENARELLTDENGVIELKNADLYADYTGDSSYYFLETRAPDGYELPQEPKVPITPPSVGESIVEVSAYNRQAGSIQILKTDAADSTIVLQGAKFILYYEVGGVKQYYRQSADGTITWSNREEYATRLVTGEDGTCTVTGLPLHAANTYYIREVEAPAGYEAAGDTPILVEVFNNQTVVVPVENSMLTGSLLLTKVDEISGSTLEGAEFILYYLEGATPYYYSNEERFTQSRSEAGTLVTDSDGVIKVDNLPVRQYYVEEIKAPDNYMLSEETYLQAVMVTASEVPAEVTVKNERESGSITILKTDDNGNAQRGVGFVLYRENNSLEEFYTLMGGEVLWVDSQEDAKVLYTDRNGRVTVEDLPMESDNNIYWVREIAPLAGFDPAPDKMATLVVDGNSADIPVRNSRTTETVTIVKVDEDLPDSYLPGAEFVLYSLESGGKQYYAGIEDGYAVWKYGSDNAAVLKTDAQGAVAVDGLIYGTYYLQETKAPEGYDLKEDIIEIVVPTDGTPITVGNNATVGNIRIVKQDSTSTAGESSTPLAGAEFVLYYMQNGEKLYYPSENLDADGNAVNSGYAVSFTADSEKAARFASDGNGEIVVTGLPYREYVLKETKAPDGYEAGDEIVVALDEPWAEIAVPNDPVGELHIRKVDSGSGQLIDDTAQFYLVRKRGEGAVQYYCLTESGVLWSSDILQNSPAIIETVNGEASVGKLPVKADGYDYYLREVTAPIGYIPMEEDIPVGVGKNAQEFAYDPVEVDVENELETEPRPVIQITLTKTERGNSENLLDASFLLFYTDANGIAHYCVDEKRDENEDIMLVWSVNRENAKVFTTTNGMLQMDVSFYGDNINSMKYRYWIEEVIAPDGYSLPSEPIEINMDEIQRVDDQGVASEDGSNFVLEIAVENDPVTDLKVTKVDADNNAVILAGARFYLYKGGAGAPQYYAASNISGEGETIHWGHKIIWTESSTQAYTFASDDDGAFVVKGLPEGNYALTEIEAPKGYQLAADQEVIITAAGGSVTLQFENKKKPTGSIAINKVDDHDEEVENAAFILYFVDNGDTYYYGAGNTDSPVGDDILWTREYSEAKRFATDSAGKVEVTGLLYNTYFMREVETPQGYEIDHSLIIFELDENTANTTVTKKVINNRIEDVTVEKRNFHTQALVPGAGFVLKNGNGEYYAASNIGAGGAKTGSGIVWDNHIDNAYRFLTGQDGKFTVAGLPLGSYTLEEVITPAGFEGGIQKSFTLPVENIISIENNPIQDVELEKVSSYNQYMTLPGARFVLMQGNTYYGENNIVNGETVAVGSKINWVTQQTDAYRFESGSNGKITISGLPYGTYTLIEQSAPAGYFVLEGDIKLVVDEKGATLTIDGTNIPTYRIPNDPVGTVEVTKVDKDKPSAGLKGAEFMLKNAENEYYRLVSGEVTWVTSKESGDKKETDEEGKVQFTGLPYGIYTVIETKAPDGYNLLEEEQTVNLEDSAYRQTVTFRNTKLGTLTIIKEDAVTVYGQPATTIDGAQFQLYRKANGAEEYYKLSSGSATWVSEPEADTLVTNNNGRVEVSGLEYGTYYIKEVAAPSGYIATTDTLEIVLGEGSNVVTVRNDPDGYLSVRKVDEMDNAQILKGAKFYLQRKDSAGDYYYYCLDDDDRAIWVKLDNLVASGLAPKLLSTDHSGGLRVESIHATGYSYYLEEMIAPEGYEKAEDLIPVSVYTTVNDGPTLVTNKKDTSGDIIRIPITLKKVDAADGTTGLSGATFIVYYVDKSSRMEYYCSSYIVGSDAGDDEYAELEWTLNREDAYLFEADDRGILALNVRFFGSLDSTDTKNEYFVQETQSPVGYILGGEPIPIEIKLAGDGTSPTVEPIVVKNDKGGEIEIVKKDATDQTVLPGAQFVLRSNNHYYAKSNVESDGTLVKWGNEIIWTPNLNEAYYFETDSSGTASIKGLPEGSYTVKEVKAPAKYIMLSEEKEVVVQLGGIHQIVFENPRDPGNTRDIDVVKVDAVSGKSLADAKFILRRSGSGGAEYYHKGNIDVNGEAVNTGSFIQWTQNESDAYVFSTELTDDLPNDSYGFSIHGLAYGTYWLVEVEVPEGYVAGDMYRFVLNGNWSNPMSISNERQPELTGDILLTKIEEGSDQKLPEAEFRLYRTANGTNEYYEASNIDGAGTVINQGTFINWGAVDNAHVFITGQNGEISVVGLPVGTYYFEETKAPDGYLLEETPKEIIIDSDNVGTVIRHTFENQLQADPTGEVRFKKVDYDDHTQLLEGAVFDLYKESESGWEAVEYGITSGVNGELKVDGLVEGSYKLEEIQPPAGYERLTDPVLFRMVRNGDTVEADRHGEGLLVKNRKIDVDTPTGSITFYKVDALDHALLLPNAVFSLYVDSGSDWDLVTSGVTSDENGEIRLTGLEEGSYKLEETRAPKGYKEGTNAVFFTMELVGDTVVAKMNGTDLYIENEQEEVTVTPPDSGEAVFRKVDEDTGAALSGAEFSLYLQQEDGTWTLWDSKLASGNDGLLRIDGLVEGVYYLEETKAPSGYRVDKEPVYFTMLLNGDGELISISGIHRPEKEPAVYVLYQWVDAGTEEQPVTPAPDTAEAEGENPDQEHDDEQPGSSEDSEHENPEEDGQDLVENPGVEDDGDEPDPESGDSMDDSDAGNEAEEDNQADDDTANDDVEEDADREISTENSDGDSSSLEMLSVIRTTTEEALTLEDSEKQSSEQESGKWKRLRSYTADEQGVIILSDLAEGKYKLVNAEAEEDAVEFSLTEASEMVEQVMEQPAVIAMATETPLAEIIIITNSKEPEPPTDPDKPGTDGSRDKDPGTDKPDVFEPAPPDGGSGGGDKEKTIKVGKEVTIYEEDMFLSRYLISIIDEHISFELFDNPGTGAATHIKLFGMLLLVSGGVLLKTRNRKQR